ncbi:hypothetical protein C8J56DRAFT_803188 [Mycena floridula]|nr:hypothetical protein C8J56DRAFT_803188 [Mycena floridula]
MASFSRFRASTLALPPPATFSKSSISAFFSRRIRFGLAIFFAILLFFFLQRAQLLDLSPGPLLTSELNPPLYEKWSANERLLPQHDPNLPFPEGSHAKFIFFSNHQHAVGWGNVLQEMVLNAQLALTLKRSRVFDNYTWDDGPEDFSTFNGNRIPSRIPLSAMISGPLIGGESGPQVPRAVSREYFQTVCPNPIVLSSTEVSLGEVPSAIALLNAWVEKLGKMEDRCIQISKDSRPIFDYMLFGSTNVLDIWPTLSVSPILTKFGWSPLILDGFAKNRGLFESSSWLPDLKLSAPSNDLLDGLMTVHIRRGDFAAHCTHFVTHSSSYNGFNSFDALPDKFVPPTGDDIAENTRHYMDHCYPSVSLIVQRIMEIKAERGKEYPLKRLFIMTNAKRPWIEDLKQALRQAGQWSSIASSRDLKLSWEQKYVAQTVDMYAAVRSQVFIGNGFSSLTSNIVMLRMAHKIEPRDTRFW